MQNTSAVDDRVLNGWPLSLISAVEFGTLVARDLEVETEALIPWLSSQNPKANMTPSQAVKWLEALLAQVSDEPDSEADARASRLRRFVHELGEPEARATFAAYLALDYATLTRWVQIADLLRPALLKAGLDLEQARTFVERAQVLGVHDLARRLGSQQGRDGLWSASSEAEKVPTKSSKDDQTLKAIGAAAALEPPHLIACTDAILVIKGAGQQKPGETLDQFTRGFWPAVQSIDADATMRNRDDVTPNISHEGELPGRVAEISSGERRIWISEPNWESAIRVAASRRAVLREWQLATWVLVLETHFFVRSWFRFLFGSLGAHPSGADAPSQAPDSPGDEAAPQAAKLRDLRNQEPWLMFTAYTTAYLLLFSFVGLALSRDGILSTVSDEISWRLVARGPFDWLQSSLLLSVSGLSSSRAGQVAVLALALFVPAAIAALPASISTLWKRYEYERASGRRDRPDDRDSSPDRQFPRPNTMTNAALLMLGAFLLLTPLRYALQLAFLMLVQLALIFARWLFWHFRPFLPSDVDEHYQSGSSSDDQCTAIESKRRRPRFPMIWYRLIVVLALPLFYLAALLAEFLKFTRILGGLGASLESAIATVIGGIMGDVVTYATDPAQAARIRSAVDVEIHAFHDMAHLDGIHVVAHSQGTPITYELLFRHLRQPVRSKLATYLTIGSVLGYYSRANAVMGDYNVQRFPVDRSPEFPAEFRWFNCWNLSDPITEFTGLDDYRWTQSGQVDQSARYKDPMRGVPGQQVMTKQSSVLLADALDKQSEQMSSAKQNPPSPAPDETPGIVFDPASPRDVRTPMSIRHHGDYWSNLEWVQRPLALRVLGIDPIPERWRIPAEAKKPWLLPHWLWVMLAHAIGVVLLLILVEPRLEWIYLSSIPLIDQLGSVERLPFVPEAAADTVLRLLKFLTSDEWYKQRLALLGATTWLVVIQPWIHASVALLGWLQERGMNWLKRQVLQPDAKHQSPVD